MRGSRDDPRRSSKNNESPRATSNDAYGTFVQRNPLASPDGAVGSHADCLVWQAHFGQARARRAQHRWVETVPWGLGLTCDTLFLGACTAPDGEEILCGSLKTLKAEPGRRQARSRLTRCASERLPDLRPQSTSRLALAGALSDPVVLGASGLFRKPCNTAVMDWDHNVAVIPLPRQGMVVSTG